MRYVIMQKYKSISYKNWWVVNVIARYNKLDNNITVYIII